MGVSVCVWEAWHGSVTVGRVGWVGRVGLDRISLLLSYSTFQSVCRCLISVAHGRYLRIGGTCSLQPSFSPGEVIVSMYMYLVISSFFVPPFTRGRKYQNLNKAIHALSLSLVYTCRSM